MVNQDRLVNNFMELVKIDSISREEREMADRLKRDLSSLGCRVREDEAGKAINGNAGNIIAELPGNHAYPTILLSAHMDRVSPGRGIEPVIIDGYIESRGDTILAGDDIIGVSAIIELLHIINERGLEHGPLKIIFSVAEEVGLRGALHLHPDDLEGLDYGIVYDVDGDVGTIVTRAPSQIKFNALIRGKSAHAGMEPGRGINAIKIASQAISAMQLGQIDEETTANIGVIRGGTASNIVPDLVELEGEVRSHAGEKIKKQVEQMKQFIKRSVERYGGQVEFDIETLYHSFSLDPDAQLIKLVTEAAADTGLAAAFRSSGGGSDANIFNLQGIPTVNLGTGMENVHSTEERVKIENIVQLVEFTINIIRKSVNYK